jgi:hypothetical protein
VCSRTERATNYSPTCTVHIRNKWSYLQFCR